MLLKKGTGARAWQAGTAPVPLSEKADTILTHDLEGTDLRTKAYAIRMEELQKARQNPALNDIRDLMHQAEPTRPDQSRCSSQPLLPGLSVTCSPTCVD